MRTFVTFFLLLFFAGKVFSQQVDFFREEISFELDSLFFTVNGEFYFRNNSDQLLSPMVTFPIGRVEGEKQLDTILVFAQEDLVNPLPVQIRDTIVKFTIYLPPGEERLFKVLYKQRHNGHSARYILTTTAFWKKPLEHAAYSLFYPGYIMIRSFSIPPDAKRDFEGARIYTWTRRAFLPTKDFQVDFIVNQSP